jgi:hypothetical protein
MNLFISQLISSDNLYPGRVRDAGKQLRKTQADHNDMYQRPGSRFGSLAGEDVKFLPHRLNVGGLIKDILGPLIQAFS